MPSTFTLPIIMPSNNPSWMQAQMDPTPKKVYGGRVDLDIESLSLNDAMEVMSNAAIPADAVESNIEFDYNEDYASVYVVWYRLETPAQVQERIERCQQQAQLSAQRRREQYEALRQEFESE